MIQSIDNGVPNDRSTSLGLYPEGARIAKGSLSSAPGTPVASGTNPVCPVANGASFTLATRWLVDQGGAQVTELAESGTNETWKHSNVFAGGHLSATWDPTGIHYALSDPLGTKRVQLNASGQIEETCQSPGPPATGLRRWGGNLPFGNDVNNPASATCILTALATVDDATEHHFTQKERDNESGNDYFGARDYASSMGRLTTLDPLRVKADRLLLPQRLNLYAYGTNNPLRFTDSTGMDVNIGHCPESMTTSMCEAAIKNGVPNGDREHIHFVEGDGKNGYAKGQTSVLLDADYTRGDTNFQTLQTAANDHSALANINIEDSGFAPSGMWSQPHGDSIRMRDFKNHFNNQGILRSSSGIYEMAFYQDWGNSKLDIYNPDSNDRGLPYSRTNATEVYVWGGADPGELSGTIYHELKHVVLGDFGRLAQRGVHGAPGVNGATKEAQEDGKKNASDQ